MAGWEGAHPLEVHQIDAYSLTRKDKKGVESDSHFGVRKTPWAQNRMRHGSLGSPRKFQAMPRVCLKIPKARAHQLGTSNKMNVALQIAKQAVPVSHSCHLWRCVGVRAGLHCNWKLLPMFFFFLSAWIFVGHSNSLDNRACSLVQSKLSYCFACLQSTMMGAVFPCCGSPT